MGEMIQVILGRSLKATTVTEAIQDSQAKVKAFIVNLQKDNDIQSLTATDILDLALYYLKDNENITRVISHVLSFFSS